MGATLEDLSVYRYLSYRAFLKDAYVHRKQTERGFSYRSFSRRAGMRSPNFLKLVMDGDRNLSVDSAERFAQALDLDATETSFFVDLVHFDQADSSAEKNRFLDRIGTYRKHRKVRRLERKAFKYLSHWYYPAIRELVACSAFEEDPTWIANHLQPRVAVNEVREALAVLQDLGLLVRDEGGKLIQGDPSFSTGNEMRSLAIGNFHRQMMERASASIEEVAQKDREISGVTVALSPEAFEMFKSKIHELRATLLEMSEQDTGASRVVQFNFQAFPLANAEPDNDEQ